MKTRSPANATTVVTYIKKYRSKTRVLLKELRTAIRLAAPGVEESISYGMPAFSLTGGGKLVYFAAYERHIGFYPTSSGIRVFKKYFTGFKYSKGALQLPLDLPLPLSLIKRIVKYRLKECKSALAKGPA
ncbi:MAG: DUF1801 domain-containing protein [Bdellovibrionota bacterium]